MATIRINLKSNIVINVAVEDNTLIVGTPAQEGG